MSDNDATPKKRQGERNPAASLQQKLRNHAKETNDDVSLVLIRYLNERFLYRLSVSPYRDRFILRGATLFTAWASAPHRATRDIDRLATRNSSSEELRNMITVVCALPIEEDGVIFMPETLNIEELAGARIYQGLHLEMAATLSTARLRLEIDIAFGEAVSPPPDEIELPVLLGKPAPHLNAYRRETVIAEKCQALVSLSLINTRMKDFYDLWYLCRTSSFEGVLLCRALQTTFMRRQTAFPAGGLPPALTDEFTNDALKQRQWSNFHMKGLLLRGSADLASVIVQIRDFLQPPLWALAEKRAFDRHWSPANGWREQKDADRHLGLDELVAEAQKLEVYAPDSRHNRG